MNPLFGGFAGIMFSLSCILKVGKIMKRPDGRNPDELRELKITKNFVESSEGSVLIECGRTRVICNASVEGRVPGFLKGSGTGWVTAEYGMLPGATGSRNRREAASGGQCGRTKEIQRLIGRSIRSVIDLHSLGEVTITLDCDVIEADGGTRTASITGAYVALVLAVERLITEKKISTNPIHGALAAISVGIFEGVPILDLNYHEDSSAETDMNVVMNEAGHFVEIQGTAEGHAFRRDEMNSMLDLAQQGIKQLLQLQASVLSE